MTEQPAIEEMLTMWPPPRPQHPGDDLPAQLCRRQVVDLGDLAQVLVGRVGEGGGTPDAGIVHQNVDRPGFVLQRD